MEQLRFELFPHDRQEADSRWREWLKDVHGLDDEGLAMFDRLIEHYGLWSAMDYSKALSVVYGKHRIEGLTVDDLGLFAHGYHTCWDRAWAARNGCTPEQVRKIFMWDYAKKEPIYELSDGHSVL